MDKLQMHQSVKTLDKILGAGFKSINLDGPSTNCNFGDTIPYRDEGHGKFDNYNNFMGFNDYEILETDEEQNEKIYNDKEPP